MNLLIVSNEDTCRSRIAQELFYSFGRGMKITTSGIAEASAVPDIVCQVMSQKGYEISRKKPTSFSQYLGQEWDYVIALSAEAYKEISLQPLNAHHIVDFDFPDPWEGTTTDETACEARIMEVYQAMYNTLYEFYRDILSEELMPRCTCGANTYCRCE